MVELRIDCSAEATPARNAHASANINLAMAPAPSPPQKHHQARASYAGGVNMSGGGSTLVT